MAEYNSRIKELEDELAKTKYNKKTQHHIGLLKAKIAKLKEKESSRGGGKGGSEGYSVKKSGDSTVVLLGFPSVGKSTLLNALTNANSEVAEYAFTTLDVIPGLMEYNHAKIQVLDVPGIVEGAASGRGRGREVLAVLRSADLVLLLIDVNQPQQYNALLKEIYDSGLRLNKKKPDVVINKTAKGGLSIGTTVKLTKVDKKTLEAILKEYRIMNAEVVIRTDITADEFIDVIEGNKKYVKSGTIVTKADMTDPKEVNKIISEVNANLKISAQSGYNIPKLKQMIYDSLGLIRIYCKEINKEADLNEPMIMQKKSSIKDMCIKLHKDFLENFRYARVWGDSAKFEGQVFKKPTHVLKDGDIVELHIK
ncbi:MAG: OBG GTPase family GTP-binding protein [Nanobdellota archaeon]